jgi:FAD/FMN-containing dehydrogenase
MNESGNRALLKLSRRALLCSIAVLPAAAAIARSPVLHGLRRSRVRPGTPGWPTEAQWADLKREVGGRLISGARPATQPLAQLLSNPFFVGDQVGLTQSSGWLGAWRSTPSVYAVHALNAADVAASVRFATKHNLRLVVKGGGHSYLGGSNAPDSLLIWTRAMDAIELHDAFVPESCKSPPVQAVSVGAGCIWGRVYRTVCVEAGRYVQGGGCTTVGVAGLVQGGGFGSFSKAFGIAAASLIEAEIVTADGKIRIVNACQDPDLFWALKGGGGGTFGVVTRLTLRTHRLPATLGGMTVAVQAQSDEAFERLLAVFLEFSRDALINPHWGERARATRDNRLSVDMSFQGLTANEARASWQHFLEKVDANPHDWKIVKPFQVLAAPGRDYWNADALAKVIPNDIKRNDGPGAPHGDYWWAGDGDQVGVYWDAYTSTWLPISLLSGSGTQRLARAWFEASRHWSVTLHFNKGLAGGSHETIAASRDTAMNPDVLDSFALAIIATGQDPAFTGWSEPDRQKGEAKSAAVHAADRALRAAAPRAGSYLSECDFFLDDWKQAPWGEHWTQLEKIKQRYDPTGLFVVHHGVGSDNWSSNGFTRAQNV